MAVISDELRGEIKSIVKEALAEVLANAQPTNGADGDDLLKPEEAAALLNQKLRWVYRHAKDWPFTRKLSRKNLRFSKTGLQKWVAARKA